MRYWLLSILFIILAACGTQDEPAPTESEPTVQEAAPDSEPDATPTSFPEQAVDLVALPASARSWGTDWSRSTIPLEELKSGGPPRDGIPPIDDPTFTDIESASWLSDGQPVVFYESGEVARAYPLAILIWHEVVNDEVNGEPITVTFCPLCNTALVFDRRVDGELLDFGTSGLLRNSDLVMWDRQTESLWQQATGEGIVGRYAGEQLAFLPAGIISVAEFRDSFPNGEVLERPSASRAAYGQNPYTNYDSSDRPFLYAGTSDERLPALSRVVGLEINGEAVAYPFDALRDSRVINDEVGGQPVALFFTPGALSALDNARIEDSRAVGSALPFDPVVDGERLQFAVEDDQIVDEGTGSTWDITGRATSGPLEGTELTPLPHANHFWFAFQAFYEDIRVWGE